MAPKHNQNKFSDDLSKDVTSVCRHEVHMMMTEIYPVIPLSCASLGCSVSHCLSFFWPRVEIFALATPRNRSFLPLPFSTSHTSNASSSSGFLTSNTNLSSNTGAIFL